MKCKANQIRSKLLVLVDEEIKSILKSKRSMNHKKQELMIDLKDFKVEFQERFASSCNDFHVEEKEDNSIEVINYNKTHSRKKSIKLLYSICSSLKPIAI